MLNSLSEKRKLKEKELDEINKKYDEIKKSDTDYFRNLIKTNAQVEAEKIRQAGGTQEEIDNIHKAAEKAASNTAGIITMIEEEKKKNKKEIDDEIVKIDEETQKAIIKNHDDSAKEQSRIEEWKKMR